MRLSEALRASKTGEANGVLVEDGREYHFLASEAGVAIAAKDDYVRCTWADLLPDGRRMIVAAKWEPVRPKNPLVQLAETLTDWIEDEQEEEKA